MESPRRHHELVAPDEELTTTSPPAAQLRPAPVSSTAGSRRKTPPRRQQIGHQGQAIIPRRSLGGNEGKEITNGQAIVRMKAKRGTPRSMARQPANTFTCFPKLPPEIRKLIWSWASVIIPASSPRVFWVAPDPDYFEYESISAALNQQLRICPDETFSNPKLLTVCQEARFAALKEYTVWGLADVETHDPLPGAAYINKAYDHVYFRGMSNFFFLELLASADDQPQNFNAPVLRQLLNQFNGIQNLAMSWEQLHLLFHDGHDIKWLRHMPSLKVLTIVYRLVDEDMRDRDSVTFKARLVLLQPGTTRSNCAAKMRWWTKECLQLFSDKFPEHLIPKVHVRQLWSPVNNDTSRDDIKFSQKLDKDYRLEGRSHFGKAWLR